MNTVIIINGQSTSSLSLTEKAAFIAGLIYGTSKKCINASSTIIKEDYNHVLDVLKNS